MFNELGGGGVFDCKEYRVWDCFLEYFFSSLISKDLMSLHFRKKVYAVKFKCG